jgi:ribokinase/sulfofructose kinase
MIDYFRLPAANSGRQFDLLAYGDPNVDYVFETEKVPRTDEKVLGRNLGVFPGGTVANVACAASLLGMRAASYGRVGTDADGHLLLNDNARCGVSNAYLAASRHRTSAAMIVVDASGEKALVYAPMPDDPLDEERLIQALRESRLLYAMPYNLDEFQRVSALARKCGVLVAIDIEAAVAPNRERLDALLACSDIVFMNEGGFRATNDAPIEPEQILPLLERGPRLIVVTMGAAGAIAATADQKAAHPAFPVNMIDATGAGDCFNGAFLTALFEGRPLSGCLAFACAAAAISVSATGARTALPDRGSVNGFLRDASS